MKVTAETVKEYADKNGLIPVQVDGVPEGFSFIEPDIQIGKQHITGRYVAFLPMREWEGYHKTTASTIRDLQVSYEVHAKRD